MATTGKCEADFRVVPASHRRPWPRTKGLEPDECFWVAHELEMRSKKKWNARKNPPPDYEEKAESLAFPKLNVKGFAGFVKKLGSEDESSLLQGFREWLRGGQGKEKRASKNGK